MDLISTVENLVSKIDMESVKEIAPWMITGKA